MFLVQEPTNSSEAKQEVKFITLLCNFYRPKHRVRVLEVVKDSRHMIYATLFELMCLKRWKLIETNTSQQCLVEEQHIPDRNVI